MTVTDAPPTLVPALAPARLTALLLGTAGGDVPSFEDLYRTTSPRVHAVVARVLRDVHLAEEVAQEVFVQVWEQAARFDPARGSALGWVTTLAHRRAVDRVRSSESGRRRDTAHVGRTDAPSYDATVAGAELAALGHRIERALARLPDVQRQAVRLACLDGLSHREVAELVGIPLGTAKTRIRVGLTRLRTHLDPDDWPASP